jgi:hypothetical protein
MATRIPADVYHAFQLMHSCYTPDPNDARNALDVLASMRRAARALHRWSELECGTDAGYLARDEATGRPFMHPAGRMLPGGWYQPTPYSIPDREKSAVASLTRLIARFPGWAWYNQTDPRGAPVYLYKVADVPEGAIIDSCYSTVGTPLGVRGAL